MTEEEKKEKRRQQNREWRLNNIERFRERDREYKRAWRAAKRMDYEDPCKKPPQKKIEHVDMGMVRALLTAGWSIRSVSYEVGADEDELRKYLEERGMAYEDQGRDHSVPETLGEG